MRQATRTPLRASAHALLAAALLTIAACTHPLAGFYLADVPNGVAMFEIDTGAGDSIAGHMRVAVADASGTLIERDLVISGTTHANTLDLQIGQPASPFAPPPPHLTGRRVGEALSLDGTDPAGRPVHFLARLCTEAAARNAITLVQTRAATARAAAQRIANDHAVQETTLAANDYTDAADSTAGRIANVAAIAPSLTAHMRAALATPRAGTLLALAQQSAIIYSQLRLALFQAANTAQTMQRRIDMATAICRTPPSGTLKADCMALASVTPAFNGAVATIARAYATATAIWQRERSAQDGILEQARQQK